MKNNFLEINYIVLTIIYISYHIYYTFGAVMRIFRIWGTFVNDCTRYIFKIRRLVTRSLTIHVSYCDEYFREASVVELDTFPGKSRDPRFKSWEVIFFAIKIFYLK